MIPTADGGGAAVVSEVGLDPQLGQRSTAPRSAATRIGRSGGERSMEGSGIARLVFTESSPEGALSRLGSANSTGLRGRSQ